MVKTRSDLLKPVYLLFLLACLPAYAAEILEGRVVAVHDGDTVTLATWDNRRVKIRLAQIDAPESDQAFGLQSRRSLSDMVYNRIVRVEEETLDKYGRTVGTIFVGGLDVSRRQIQRGMAWAYRQYLHDESLVQDENTARQARVGLWSEANPTPPWEYRSTCGSKHYCSEMSSCREAMRYLTECGLSQLDRNHNGIPCESLCGR